MNRAGMTRLVMALNPDHGRAPYEQPTGFWWDGPGGGRVFVWLSTHYGVGEQWGVVDGDAETAEREIAAFLARLELRDDYPYDTAIVHAANDNRWPTARFLDVVRRWNDRHPLVPMRTATIDEALDVVEAQAGADAPVVRGEWSDWWGHGHGSTAREVAVYREARSFALAASTTLGLARLRGDAGAALAEVVGYRRGPVRLRSDVEIARDLDQVDEELLLFAEHSWGSWETYAKPHSTFSHSHWNAKAGFAYGAFDLARDLAVEGWFRLVGSGPDGSRQESGEPAAGPMRIVVINPTERDRTEPVDVEVEGRTRARTVIGVPAFSVASVPVPPVPGPPRSSRELAFGRYRAVVDPACGGVVSLVDFAGERELVDPGVPHGLGAVVTETVRPGSTHPMLACDPKHFHPDFPGPELDRNAAAGTEEPLVTDGDGWARIVWRTTPRGLPPASTALTLYRDVDVVDLEVAIVKPESFGPESIHVAFPFLVPEPEFLLETAGAVYAAESEQLPDTSKDWYSIQHAIGIASASSSGVLWGTFDAPLVQLGGFHTGEWARTLQAQGGHVNSWLMNNFHFTNFQARQEGTRTYRYRFASIARPSREDVRVFGRNLLVPLQARAYDGPLRLLGPAGLRVEPAERVLAELRPVEGGLRVRLRNLGAEPVEATVTWEGPPSGRSQVVERVALGPFGVDDVVLRRDSG
jgi:hypothetical protein